MMVEVRELVWVEASSRVFDAAAYGMGLYRVKREEGGWTAFKYGDTFRADCSTLDEAKAAAQADFEYRILSALSPADRPMEVSAMRELPRDLVTILRTEAKNQRTPPIDYVIAEDGGRMVHRPDPDIAMAELLEEAASALAAKDAELAEVRQQYVDANEARIDAEAQLAEARKALEPFALVAEHDISEDEADSDPFRPMPKPFNHAPQITVGHLRAALRALEGGESDE